MFQAVNGFARIARKVNNTDEILTAIPETVEKMEVSKSESAASQTNGPAEVSTPEMHSPAPAPDTGNRTKRQKTGKEVMVEEVATPSGDSSEPKLLELKKLQSRL